MDLISDVLVLSSPHPIYKTTRFYARVGSLVYDIRQEYNFHKIRLTEDEVSYIIEQMGEFYRRESQNSLIANGVTNVRVEATLVHPIHVSIVRTGG